MIIVCIYLDHGVIALLLVHIGELYDARAEFEEGTVQEAIDEEDVAHGVGQVEQLARERGHQKTRVGVHRIGQVLGQSHRSGFALVVVVAEDESSVAFGDVLHFPGLPALPEPVRQVEQ